MPQLFLSLFGPEVVGVDNLAVAYRYAIAIELAYLATMVRIPTKYFAAVAYAAYVYNRACGREKMPIEQALVSPITDVTKKF